MDINPLNYITTMDEDTLASTIQSIRSSVLYRHMAANMLAGSEVSEWGDFFLSDAVPPKTAAHFLKVVVPVMGDGHEAVSRAIHSDPLLHSVISDG